jgi:GNAT superfamily N-acetyltransferase
MKVKSLAYRTDLLFPAFDGEIVDRGEYLVIRTPANPRFYWGNFLLFRDPPRAGDERRWPELFAQEIGAPPAFVHQTFGWDSTAGEEGASRAFLAAGFRLSRCSVLTAGDIHFPPRHSRDVVVRTLATDEDWRQALELQVETREPEHGESTHREFRRRMIARYRAMIHAGLGAWFGAFLDGLLVADLGIFHDRAVGRYQSVATRADYRRRGIAGTLVGESGRVALDQFGLRRLAIVAEAGSAAARLYEACGFRQTEFQMGLERWDWTDAREKDGG